MRRTARRPRPVAAGPGLAVLTGFVLLLLAWPPGAGTLGSRSGAEIEPPHPAAIPAGPEPAVARPGTPPTWPEGAAVHPVAAGPGQDWPELHRDPGLSGVDTLSSLSTGNAPRLGVAWATDLYGAALDSPVVAFDPLLGIRVAYVGNEAGDVLAIDTANGSTVWGSWLGSPILSTPAVYGGSLYVATARSPALYRLNATTGATQCSIVAPESIAGSPTVVALGGHNATVFVGLEDTNTRSGPLWAVNATTCRLDWSFTGFPQLAGSWDPVAVAADRTGATLVLFGTADPDSAVYALNASTGTEVWRFHTHNPPPGAYDVGAGVTISPPGKNGFADGVAYVPNKFGIMYALDLSNGTRIWKTNFDRIAGVTEGGRSTAALYGQNLVFGYNGGLFDLNATSGAVRWEYKDRSRTEAISSPAIAGTSPRAIVAVGDVAGTLDVVALTNGTPLYRYQTGGYLTGSPAISGSSILIASTDGFLYDFAPGGGNDPVLPSTTVSTPATGAVLANPNGVLLVNGSASDRSGLAGVVVALQSGGVTGPWWDAKTRSWSPGPIGNPATTVRTLNGTSANWSFGFPAPTAGGTFEISAYAVAASGQADIAGARIQFSINYSTKGPHFRATASYVAPGSTVTVIGGGFGASESVSIRLAGALLATAPTTGTGYLPARTVTIPLNASFGPSALNATGLSSGRAATTPIFVANSWTQYGGTAAHPGFEPNDPVLSNLITPGGHIWVDPAWHFDVGSPLNGSPAIVDGTAYGSTAAGQLYAVDTHNGALIWNWSDGTGAALNGSPAVDPSAGLALVSEHGGILDAVRTSTGTLAWSTTLTGGLTSPALANGAVYVASSTGAVTALVESNGAVSWSTTLAGPVLSTPTVDLGQQRLFAGDANGSEVALNVSTGAVVWTYAGHGSIRSSAAVGWGAVYLGSTDGNVTALRESTGIRIWTYQVNGPIAATPALSDSGTPGGNSRTVLVGSGNGTLYQLDTANGSLDYKISVGGSLVGVSEAKGVAVYETSKGAIGAIRAYTNLQIWQFATAAGLSGAPAIVDGAIFVSAEDGSLYAFTSYGQSPE